MHLAIIPDGNRRWSKRRRGSLHQAYAIGFCNVVDISLRSPAWGIKHLTFYGLSGENLRKRPAEQVDSLFWQITDSMAVANPLFQEQGLRVRFQGDLESLRPDYQTALAEITETSQSLTNPLLIIDILVNYSPEWDLVDYPQHLQTESIPEIDIIYRSGATRRLSGFLPIQSSYAELYFSKRLWPDINHLEIHRVISDKLRIPSLKGR
ncbi:MAG: hypothetical protein HC801_13305 [Nitrospira sp.]|nr:hypothetical protein [Nitrospira sp.]